MDEHSTAVRRRRTMDSIDDMVPSTPKGSNNDGLTLKEVASQTCKRIDIGAAVLPQPLSIPDVQDYGGNDDLVDVVSTMETAYSRTLRQEFNSIVVEHHMKWSPLLCPTIDPHGGTDKSEKLGCYDFEQADKVVDWAIRHGMKVKGHVLVWHVTSPIRLLEQLTPEQVREELRRHIFTVMGHFRGRIKVYDVVNESLAPDGSLAHNFFYKTLGPSYIEDSFRWAHEADPSATLLYNDNKVEGIGSSKAEGFYRLLLDLKKKGVPVHGCGMQAHWNAAGSGANLCPTPRQLKAQIHRLGELGLTVNLSEMDVRVSQLSQQELRPVAQSQIYHDMVAAALSEPACDGIWLWGFTDRHTWVTHFYYDDEPLILDEHYARKPAYFGLREALMTLTPKGTVGGNVPLDKDVDSEGGPWGHQWRKTSEEVVDGVFIREADGIMKNDDRPDWQVPEHPKKRRSERSRLDSEGDELSGDENEGPIEFKAPNTEIA